MSPNNETLLLSAIDRLSEEVRELRGVVSTQTGIIARLETEVDELKRKFASRADWSTWIMRTVAGALIASALAGGGYFARGCSPQNVVVTK